MLDDGRNELYAFRIFYHVEVDCSLFQNGVRVLFSINADKRDRQKPVVGLCSGMLTSEESCSSFREM